MAVARVTSEQPQKEKLNYRYRLPWSNAFWPELTPFGPPMWQAEADTELRLFASSTTAVGQKALLHGNPGAGTS